MRIFIDVGAHFGESIFKALNPRLGFDLILAFEPSEIAASRLDRIKDPRVRINRFGLGNGDSITTLYGGGSLGASIFMDKTSSSSTNLELIKIKSAEKELQAFLTPENEIFMKMNCEGGELDILENLAKSELLREVDHLYVDWDARKIPSLKNRYLEIRTRVEASSTNLNSADSYPFTGWKGVELWLTEYATSKANLKDKIRYGTFGFLPMKYRVREALKAYLPDLYEIYVKAKA